MLPSRHPQSTPVTSSQFKFVINNQPQYLYEAESLMEDALR